MKIILDPLCCTSKISGLNLTRPKYAFNKTGISVQKCPQYAPLAQIRLTPNLEEVRVDMADMKVEKRPVTLVTNVGSCIAICIHDSANSCGGMAHIMLPTANGASNPSLPFKYADTAVPALAEAVKKLGKEKASLSAKIAGGANMFSNLRCQLLNVGEKNAEAVKLALKVHRIPLIAEDIGGNTGRRVAFDVFTGVVRVKTINGDEKIL